MEYQAFADYWRNKLRDPNCTAKNADILLNKLAKIRIKVEEIENIFKEGGVKIACASKLDGVKNMRKRWHSCYAGKELGVGVGIFIYQDSKHFTVEDKIFELTSGLAGRLLDKMIEHQLCGDKRYIRFSRASRNLFKRLKCVNNKTVNARDYFFTKVVELQLDNANSNKIVGAKLKDDLFGV